MVIAEDEIGDRFQLKSVIAPVKIRNGVSVPHEVSAFHGVHGDLLPITAVWADPQYKPSPLIP
jgi:hypothetical protein